MTYNIHKGIGGVDRKYRLERIVDTVSYYAPDVLLLQEVDDDVPRSHGDRQIDVLGDQLGFSHRVFQPNVKLRRGMYGNAILSRHPLHETHDVDLTLKPKKRRRAQIVKLRLTDDGQPHDRPSRTVIIANLHLGLAAFERRFQLLKLLANRTLVHAHATTPTIIAGDFNDLWHNLGVGSLGANQFEPALRRSKTFPAAYPMRCLDGIYFRGPLRLHRGFVGHTEVARHASDHLPAIAEFEISMDSES